MREWLTRPAPGWLDSAENRTHITQYPDALLYLQSYEANW